MNYALWFSSSYQHYWICSIIKHFCWKWQTIRDLLCSNLFADTACLISEAAGVLFDDTCTCIIKYDGIKCATTCYWLRFDNNFKIIERKIWGKKSQMFLYLRERERERESIISISFLEKSTSKRLYGISISWMRVSPGEKLLPFHICLHGYYQCTLWSNNRNL